ncbi:hypothetical protein R3P38DRAFT_2910889 [Favolaschia claudopus]|uniref:Uncharacterized protein n=1 Tax=Favolaschia claudopus TaxID=2862362 RepID=A0AAW0CB13_9AGAR
MDSYDQNVNNNTIYGTDGTAATGRRTGALESTTGSTGMGRSDNFNNDTFNDSSRTTGGGYQDRFDNTGSNMGSTMGGNTASSGMGGGLTGGMRSGMTDTSYGGSTGTRTDDLSQGTGAGLGRNEYDNSSSTGRNTDFGGDNFESRNREREFDSSHNKPSMGDKLKGGAEQLAGKMTGNAGLQERGQERKMGEFNERNNDF